MDKAKVLEKIKKCLALSKSANEHEAAQALKQMQALMREYGISDADVALSDIKQHACTDKTAKSAAAVYEPESRLMMCVVAMNALAWTVANINQGVGR